VKQAWRLAVVALAGLAVVQTAAAPKWSNQKSGVKARLRGVSAVSDTVAWASGADGTVLRTADGGRRWAKLAVPGAEALDFRDVDAVDERTAYVLSIGPGGASRIYKTIDAGATWTLQFTNEKRNAFFDAMAFWDAERGIAVSDSVEGEFYVLMTADGGRTWMRLPPDRFPDAQASEGFFAASGTNVAVWGSDHVWLATGAADVTRVLRSADRGETWAVAETPVPGGPSAGIFSVAFRDALHGIAVGGDYEKEFEAYDNAAITGDGGATWTRLRGLGGFRSVVAYVPGAPTPSVVAVGPLGADHSTDEGQTWTRLAIEGLHAFSFSPTGARGWGVGEDGRIARLDGLLP
jgi:photosystem II stability/assembly factor-like uncharacterized protein